LKGEYVCEEVGEGKITTDFIKIYERDQSVQSIKQQLKGDHLNVTVFGQKSPPPPPPPPLHPPPPPPSTKTPHTHT